MTLQVVEPTVVGEASLDTVREVSNGLRPGQPTVVGEASLDTVREVSNGLRPGDPPIASATAGISNR